MLTISQLQFTWPKSSTVVLTIPKLHIARGEHVFLHGPSGSGKSTLLGLIAGTLDCQQGEIEIAGTNASALSRGQRDKFRADHIGTIFQNFNLLPYLSPIENVTLGCEFSKKRRQNISSQNKSLEQEAKILLCDSWYRRAHSAAQCRGVKYWSTAARSRRSRIYRQTRNHYCR